MVLNTHTLTQQVRFERPHLPERIFTGELTPEIFIEVLLVGTGTELRRLPEELKLALKSRGISSDPMSTGAAVRTFNIMLAEQRAVAAALIAV